MRSTDGTRRANACESGDAKMKSRLTMPRKGFLPSRTTARVHRMKSWVLVSDFRQHKERGRCVIRHTAMTNEAGTSVSS